MHGIAAAAVKLVSKAHTTAEGDLHRKERNVLGRDVWRVNESGIDSCGTLTSRQKHYRYTRRWMVTDDETERGYDM